MTRIAFVVMRYGTEISGGAEAHCRAVAERLTPHYDIDVLTTCAQDYVTWANVYPAGVEELNGITVRRFPNVSERAANFGPLSARIFTQPHNMHDELNWLRAQGPHAPALLEYLLKSRDTYDAVIFFGYLYYPTSVGMRLLPEKALFVPTAHDESAIYLQWFQSLFRTPRAILYNTPEEKELVEELFGVAHIPNVTVGLGIAVPSKVEAQRFRQQHEIDAPYIYYVGRLSHSKNCQELIDYFLRLKSEYPDEPLKLVHAGTSEIEVSEHPDIVRLGFVSEEEKYDAWAGAEALVLPSKLESLSIITLESMALGVPVLCNGHSDVLRGHCLRSNAGLFYDTYDEFVASLAVLRQSQKLRQRMAQNGKEYVAQNYAWPTVIEKYRCMIQTVIDEPWL